MTSSTRHSLPPRRHDEQRSRTDVPALRTAARAAQHPVLPVLPRVSADSVLRGRRQQPERATGRHPVRGLLHGRDDQLGHDGSRGRQRGPDLGRARRRLEPPVATHPAHPARLHPGQGARRVPRRVDEHRPAVRGRGLPRGTAAGRAVGRHDPARTRRADPVRGHGHLARARPDPRGHRSRARRRHGDLRAARRRLGSPGRERVYAARRAGSAVVLAGPGRARGGHRYPVEPYGLGGDRGMDGGVRSPGRAGVPPGHPTGVNRPGAWRRYIFTGIWLVYLLDTASGVGAYSHGWAAAVGYLLLPVYGATYLVALAVAWGGSLRRFWVGYAVMVAITA